MSSIRRMFAKLKRRKASNEPMWVDDKDIGRYEYAELTDFSFPQKALNLGCSGGGGHNAAIEAIIAVKKTQGVECPPQKIIHSTEKDQKHSQAKKINLGLKLLSKKLVSWFIKPLPLPSLPTPQEITTEIENNLDKDKAKKERGYVDVLLDFYPTGYQNAAIWNVLQKQDRVEDLKKLVKMQGTSDKENYKDVRDAIYNMLMTAFKEGKPYTEINCTQAMCLPGICDGLIKYNNEIGPRAPQVRIKQYMTDIATEGAVHFIPVLSKLTPTQKGVMELYGIGLSKLPQHMKDQLKIEEFANGGLVNKELSEDQVKDLRMNVSDIQPGNNPMVRPGFKAEELKNIRFNADANLKIKHFADEAEIAIKPIARIQKFTRTPFGKKKPKLKAEVINTQGKEITIEPNEKVAIIEANVFDAADKAKYVNTLLEQNYDHIFVMDSEKANKQIDQLLDHLVSNVPAEDRAMVRESINNKIVRLGTEKKETIATIKSRADAVAEKIWKKVEIPHPDMAIEANAKVAAVMLGSQGGMDTVGYVKAFLESGQDYIFVFGGQRKRTPDQSFDPKSDVSDGIDKMLDDLVAHLPENQRAQAREAYNSKIVRLGNQSDTEISKIMTRAQTVITRAGGLSVMEQMALNAHLKENPQMAAQKQVFVHHAESGKPELFSGIEWEDKNCEYLINFLREQGVKTAEKTSPERIGEQMKGIPALKDELKNSLETFINEKAPVGSKPIDLADINFAEIAVPNISGAQDQDAGDKARVVLDPVRQAAAKLYLLVETENSNVELTPKDLKALYTNQQLKETLQHYEKLGVLPQAYFNVKHNLPSEVNLKDLEVTHQRSIGIKA